MAGLRGLRDEFNQGFPIVIDSPMLRYEQEVVGGDGDITSDTTMAAS